MRASVRLNEATTVPNGYARHAERQRLSRASLGADRRAWGGNLSAMEQDPYQQRIEELRSQLHEVYRQASEAGPEALQPESPFYRQVENLITKITTIHMEMVDWPWGPVWGLALKANS